jgi:hypothetical protein
VTMKNIKSMNIISGIDDVGISLDNCVFLEKFISLSLLWIFFLHLQFLIDLLL